jgi:hypothetical protein
MAIPKVFISYSHDTQEHKHWVLDLATRLRNSGIDAIIDQWELKPGDDLPHFMETHLAKSDYVVMVCSDRYVEKANSGTGGVGYEKMIITADLLSNIDSNKVIPIIRQIGTHNVPTFLKTKLFVDFSNYDEYEFSFDELVRTFHNAPIFEKPEIGNNPFTPVDKIRPDKTSDPLKSLMVIIITNFESGSQYTAYSSLIGAIGSSRIMLDMLLKEAEEKNLIQKFADGDILLLHDGKRYAIEHKIIKV